MLNPIQFGRVEHLYCHNPWLEETRVNEAFSAALFKRQLQHKSDPNYQIRAFENPEDPGDRLFIDTQDNDLQEFSVQETLERESTLSSRRAMKAMSHLPGFIPSVYRELTKKQRNNNLLLKVFKETRQELFNEFAKKAAKVEILPAPLLTTTSPFRSVGKTT